MPVDLNAARHPCERKERVGGPSQNEGAGSGLTQSGDSLAGLLASAITGFPSVEYLDAQRRAGEDEGQEPRQSEGD